MCPQDATSSQPTPVTWQTLTDALSPPRRDSALNKPAANERSEGRSYHANATHDDCSVDDYRQTFRPRNQLPRTPASRASLMPHQPDSPSPIRCVVHEDTINGCSENSSPSVPRLPDTPTNTYEVPGSFLNAMVSLLERQANIVPEHLFTEADVHEACEEVRRQMLADFDAKQAAQNDVLEKTKKGVHAANEAALKQVHQMAMREMQEAGRKLEGVQQTLVAVKEMEKCLGTTIKILGTVSAMVLGASLGLIRRALLVHPEDALQLADGAWRGGACGLVGILLFKGMLDAFDGRRGIYI